MAYIDWEEKHSVGVKDMDDQHKKLFALINDYYEAITQKKTKQATAQLLQGLLGYVRYHFGDEERLMLANDYPGYQQQKAQHDHFIATVHDYQKRTTQQTLLLPLEITGFLKDWLVEHIQGADKQYGPFLNAKGLR